MSAGDGGWAAALDELEGRLRRQEAVVLGHSTEVPPAALPEVQGPLPPELVARAGVLLDRSRDLERRAAVVLAEHRRRDQRMRFADPADRGVDHGML